MNEKLFSYGTLQFEQVQIKNFGRKLVANPDALLGYELRDCLIQDPQVIKLSGKATHPIACFTGNFDDFVGGEVFDITSEELQRVDQYEVDDYKRISCTLQSGEQAWVYVQSGLNIDSNYLQEGAVRLELFQDHHIAALYETAKDSRIWQHHRSHFEDKQVFESVAMGQAKEAIKHKTRCMFVIYYHDKIIGSTSYYDIHLNHLRMSIGYSWLHPDYWGKGVNTIVKNLMLSYAFEQLKFRRIDFCIDSENLRSRRAVEKLGVSFEGVLRKQQVRPDGSARDSVIYAITDDRWKNK